MAIRSLQCARDLLEIDGALFLAYLQWQTCLVYLDDVIVYARDFDEHLEWPKEVFERFQQADLKLKPLKRIHWTCDLSSRCEHRPREDGS